MSIVYVLGVLISIVYMC